MKDELDGSYINKFIALGPKTLASKTKNGHIEIKLKGFSQTAVQF